jgi:hypothetical protein
MEMEDKTKSGYESEFGKSFIPSMGNSISATYTYSWKGIKDSNKNFILKWKRSSVWRGTIYMVRMMLCMQQCKVYRKIMY